MSTQTVPRPSPILGGIDCTFFMDKTNSSINIKKNEFVSFLKVGVRLKVYAGKFKLIKYKSISKNYPPYFLMGFVNNL